MYNPSIHIYLTLWKRCPPSSVIRHLSSGTWKQAAALGRLPVFGKTMHL
jgi:hypothetical protein